MRVEDQCWNYNADVLHRLVAVVGMYKHKCRLRCDLTEIERALHKIRLELKIKSSEMLEPHLSSTVTMKEARLC